MLNRVARERYPDGFANPEVIGRIASFRAAFDVDNAPMATSEAFPMMPERILAETRSALPDDAYITTDVGWNKNGVGQQFPIRTPGTVLTPGGFATMGFGPSAAIGAKPPHLTARWCRWWATADSARTQRCSRQRSSTASASSGLS